MLILTAAPWSLAMGVLGLWLLAQPHTGLLGGPMVSLSAGVAMICIAQLVFLICVADRLFPGVHRPMRAVMHGGLLLTFLCSGGVLLVAGLLASV